MSFITSNKWILSIVALAVIISPFAIAQDIKQKDEPQIKVNPLPVSDNKKDNKKPDETMTTDPYVTYQQLNLFGDVFERVRSQYVDEVSDEKLMEYAINGMLSSLDPHSAYLNAKDFDDMRVQTKGEFGGLGIEVTMEEGLVKVVSPIDETPAAKAGLKTGDFIVQLDDKPIVGLSLSEAVEKMRGKVGTNIKLTVRRENVNEPLEFNIKRDVIKIQSVRSRLEAGTIGYIRVTTFNQNTDQGVISAIDKIKKEAGHKLIGYVLDLRNNPGGLLDQAISVSDAFLDKGEIVSTRGRSTEDIKRDNATAGDITGGLPIIVIINGGSASAAEIVAGALQDQRRAIVIGTKSFGKGSVQTVVPLPGNGAMRLTTARYYTPSGRSIQATGIEPDIEVELAKLEKIDDQRIHEADLKGALVNPNGDTAEPPKSNAKDIREELDKKSGDADKNGLSPEAQDDYQLGRAIDLLKGVSLYENRNK
jgi:carboxyl-terminal processing protease